MDFKNHGHGDVLIDTFILISNNPNLGFTPNRPGKGIWPPFNLIHPQQRGRHANQESIHERFRQQQQQRQQSESVRLGIRSATAKNWKQNRSRKSPRPCRTDTRQEEVGTVHVKQRLTMFNLNLGAVICLAKFVEVTVLAKVMLAT
jgi:ABC-type protease/lipase transport system fused ATPase/permease subunit